MPARLLPALLLLPILLTLAVSLRAGEAAVPAVTSAAPHPLMAVLSEKDYAAAAKVILDGCDRAKLQASTEPEAGMLVDQVNKGSPGEQLGIVPGEVVTALDGVFMPDPKTFNDHRNNQSQHITVRSPTGEERTLTIAPGKLGISFHRLDWRPELTYLRHSGRVATYDDDMLVACLAGTTEADLRETALARVAAAGGEPSPWLSLATWVAAARGRYDDAIAYGYQALEHDTDGSAAWRVGTLIFKAAIAGDRLTTARAIMPRLVASPSPAWSSMTTEAIIAQLDARLAAKVPPATKAPSKMPLATPEGLEHRAEALSELAGHMLAGDDVGGLEAVRRLGTGRSLAFSATDAKLQTFPLGPYGRNCSLKGILTYHFPVTHPGLPNALVKIGLYDTSKTEKIISIFDFVPMPQEVSIYQEGLPGIILDSATRVGSDCAISLRISVLDDRTEMAINGVTIFQGTITSLPTRRLGMYLSVRMVTGSLEGLSWKIDEASSRETPKPPHHVPAGSEKSPAGEP